MPAILPSRLRQQAALLAEQAEDPAAYLRSLHHLLEFYADHTQQPGTSSAPRPLLTAYHIRPPVLRQLLHELQPLAQEDPVKALALCDALWKEPFLEFRLLAAALLGQLETHSKEPILLRLKEWLNTKPEEQLTVALLDQGLKRLRKEEPQATLELVRGWLTSSDSYTQYIGLRALLPMVHDADFENLPAFFRLLTNLSRRVPAALRPDMLDVLAALAARTPVETAFFLRQSLAIPDSPDTPWLIRQSLKAFPPDLQESLRRAVRSPAP